MIRSLYKLSSVLHAKGKTDIFPLSGVPKIKQLVAMSPDTIELCQR